MKTFDLTFASIPEVASLLRLGEVSSLELTELMLERIERHADLNAFITVTGDLARDQARRADDAFASGRDRGPLQGIPIAIKDLFATRGVRTTAGTRLLEDWIPDFDATVVTKLSDAGAVCLGKTGLHELAYGSTSINEVYGAIRNPWDVRRHPGGSSGGSAVAVAAGLAYAALGTDTGCSIRQPAHCCGITGHKPTFGLVSKAGVVPLVWTMDHVGPLTRSARDAALLLQVLAGPDLTDPYSAMREPGDLLAHIDDPIRGMNLGVPRRWFFEGGEPDVIGRVDESLEAFSKLGANVIDVDVPDAEQAWEAAAVTFAEVAGAHGEAAMKRPQGFTDVTRGRIEENLGVPAARYAAAQHVRRQFIRNMERLMSSVDALLTPVSTIAPEPIEPSPEGRRKERWKNTGIFNFTGQPSISVPCGFTAEGLPVGMMVTGRWFEDARVLQIAHAYQTATGWHTRRPSP